MKTCRDCSQELPLSEFPTNGWQNGKRCYRPVCRPCRRKEKLAERLADPERYRAYKRDAYYRHHERHLAEKRDAYAHRKDDPEFRRERYAAQKRWRERNPDKVRAKSLRDARSRQMGRDPAALEWFELVRRDPCSYCGAEAGTVDHIEPLALGGENAWENLTGACLSCNCTKRHTPLLQFLLV